MSAALTLSRQDAESVVRSWGYPHVFQWIDGPLAHYRAHTNSKNSTHFILTGEFSIVWTKQGSKQTLGPGGRVDIPAGVMHEVLIGRSGCTYIVGEK